MCGNSVLEGINDYNKVVELFENVMKPDQIRENEDVEGFGYHLGDGATINDTSAPGVEQKEGSFFQNIMWHITTT